MTYKLTKVLHKLKDHLEFNFNFYTFEICLDVINKVYPKSFYDDVSCNIIKGKL